MFKTFYSTDALKNALTSATDGDVITLSPGIFKAANITKAVTIRGAGFGALDSLSNNNVPHTIINGSLNLNIPANEAGHTLSIEGVEFTETVTCYNVDSPIFSRVKFKGLSNQTGSSSNYTGGVNVSLIHCILLSASSSYTFNSGCNLHCCHVKYTSTSSSFEYTEFSNCIIEAPNSSASSYISNRNCIFNNCIFLSNSKSY